MICPNCGHDNLPGNEECSNCGHDLTELDRPHPWTRVEQSLLEDQVQVLRPKEPISVRSTTTIQEAIPLMLRHNIGSLLVVDNQGNLLGILSERDLLKKMAGLVDNHDFLLVSQFMTPKPETVTLADPLAFALHKMDVGGYRHLPVVHQGKPVGVISVRDIVRHITRLCKNN